MYSSRSRHLEDVLKTSIEDEVKDAFIKTNVFWEHYAGYNKLMGAKMNVEIAALLLKNLFDWSQRCIPFNDDSEYKKAKGVNKNILEKISNTEYEDILFIKSVWGIIWIEWKVKIIEQELMKST